MTLLDNFAVASESFLTSPVIATFISGVFAFAGVLVTLRLSQKKTPKVLAKRNKSETALDRTGDHLTYAGYEALIKDLSADADRLRIIALSREKMIDDYRSRDDRHFMELEKKNEEIARLKHLRDYADHANKIAEKDK